jgi:hypothetical protein
MRNLAFRLLASISAMAVTGLPVLKAGESSPVTFERDIEPILTRAGCNAGACHGKARGQNGFALSLLGFDVTLDYDAIVREGGGRRVSRLAPAESLLLLKAAARVPHGGGLRLPLGGSAYATLLRWIANGMPRTPSDAPRLVRIAVVPTERTLKRAESFSLQVTAHFSDGSREDVSGLAAFASSESALVSVDADGRITAGPVPGDATISARFGGLFANCDVNIPLPGEVPRARYDALPRSNFIDELVWTKLRKLGLLPSSPTSDATYLRRAYLDVIGRIPSAEEVREFLADASPAKRERLVDRLLARPEYADHWANKWVDLLRPNPYRVGIKAVLNLDGWIREAFRRNMPYDRFVYEIVTARGSTFEQGPATIFRDRREPEEIAPMISQLFLGIRLECAKCHHHPFESWDHAQFYEFAAYFARVGRKGTGLSPPISGGEEIVYTAASGSVKHPRTGKILEPRPLYGSAPVSEDPDSDPRQALARWIIAPENPYFTRVIANRIWAEIMGRGIVDPVDDLRATNPPSNAALLDALADDFRRHGYDQKHLIRTILTSSVYALSSEPNDRNVADTRNFSRHYRQRLRAEVLLDAISDVTQVPDNFAAAPPGSRAATIWTHRVPSLFLDTFGRPDPNQDPPCERTTDTSVVQALHLMNSAELHKKVTSDGGRATLLARSKRSPREIVEDLYLLTYNRYPTEDESSVGVSLFEGPKADRRIAVEDLLWALLNSAEFVFKD